MCLTVVSTYAILIKRLFIYWAKITLNDSVDLKSISFELRLCYLFR